MRAKSSGSMTVNGDEALHAAPQCQRLPLNLRRTFGVRTAVEIQDAQIQYVEATACSKAPSLCIRELLVLSQFLNEGDILKFNVRRGTEMYEVLTRDRRLVSSRLFYSGMIYVSILDTSSEVLLSEIRKYSKIPLVRSRLARFPALYASFLKSRFHLYNMYVLNSPLSRSAIPLTVYNKAIARGKQSHLLNMIKRGSGAGCSEFNWLFIFQNGDKKNGAKLRLLRNFRSFKRLDENPNMKRIDIARMMKIPSSTLNTILAKRTTLESACNDGNSSTRK
ncbi:hypothetical protein T4A_4940 [Trichinella pseudospiralis]|uniref:HTH psq-type domain-containing protein n=1 Tax=Trichinella pseudospiralis TaxID=6337 RepID=A0A0V1FG16_TRIPS|nr:hypothetical protein T4A_4940 [Trichinella pseudospiralis]KRY84908.1 hypothetical protein T4D_3367 [Trichinella pseudospiralis]